MRDGGAVARRETYSVRESGGPSGGLELELSPEGYDVLWFKMPAPERLREGCSFMIAVAAKRHPAVCYTSWDGRLQYGLVMPKGGLKELRGKDWVGESVRAAPGWLAEHVLAGRDGRAGDARSGGWRFGLTKRLARRIGRYRWAQNAWLKRQHDLRFGREAVKLRIPPQSGAPVEEDRSG